MSARPGSRGGGFRPALLGLLGLTAAGLAGCFTEVGNPADEPAMALGTRVDYTPDTAAGPDSVRITTLRLRFLEAHYVSEADTSSGEHPLWASRAGTDLDFVDREGLRWQALGAATPARMDVRLGLSPAAASIHGTYRFGGTERGFRFALPDSLDFALSYDSTALATWKIDGDYACRLVFFARRWLSLPGLDTAALSAEGSDSAVAVFDAAHNPDLHRALTQRFYRSFNGPREYSGKKSEP